jgi:methyltransferase (TIGR00027 family)
MNSPINDVSDTAFWIAYHRALESARGDALFKDPWAAALAGERGRRISEEMPTSGIVAWTVALRTRIIDEYLASAIESGIDTVLSLGAGLDARPYRMKLPASLQWIEADYPHVIEYKESMLRDALPGCRLERVKIDLADTAGRQALLERINTQAQGLLILTEGVVPYLANDAVASLADELRSMNHARYWVLDYFSPLALEFRRRRAVERGMANAPFKFAPADWFGFFKDHGWILGQIRYFPEEAQRLGRPMPLPLLVRAMARISRLWMPAARREAFRTFGGYALLEPSTGRR